MLLVLDHRALRTLLAPPAGPGPATPGGAESSLTPAGEATRAVKRRRVVVIGNFDGVHLGHQELFAQARALLPPLPEADQRAGGPPLVVTLSFWPHPVRVLAPAMAPPLITSRRRKHELLSACGVDVLIEQPFDLSFAALTPAQFVSDLLVGSLQADAVCVGYDFNFGKGRSGNAEILRGLLSAAGVPTRVVPAFSVPVPTPVQTDDGAGQVPVATVCSSSGIRKAVAQGLLAPAATLLGRPVEVEGEVVHGAARGRDLGFPTANLKPEAEAELLPKVGIYAAWAEVLGPAADPESTGDGLAQTIHPRPVIRRYPAAVSVGYNATFTGASSSGPGQTAALSASADPDAGSLPPPGGTQGSTWPQLSIEAHLIQPAGSPWLDLYGQTLRLSLHSRLRDELRFESIPALCAQIARDVDTVKTLLGVTS